MADVSILHFSSFGGGTFFGSIGSFFSGIGKFFENLCKDPLKTLMAIGSAILTAVSVGAAAPFLVNMIGDLALTMIFASTAAVAIGFDLQWLQAALAIFGFIVCAYNWTIGWSQYSSSLVNLLGLGKDAAQMLTELSIVYRLVVVAVAAY